MSTKSSRTVLKPKIDDWRSMVDCVMVDPAYDGAVFKVALSDVPERNPLTEWASRRLPQRNSMSMAFSMESAAASEMERGTRISVPSSTRT